MTSEPTSALLALRQAAATPEFKAAKKSWYQQLAEADRDLKLLIRYLRTGQRPPKMPEGEPMLGAVPFTCAHPEEFPVRIPKALQAVMKELFALGVVPPPTITVAEWRFLLKKVDSEEAASPDGSIYGTRKYEQLDPWWIASLYNSLTSVIWARFGTAPRSARLPESVSIGIVGDWGTGVDAKYAGRNPAQKVMHSLLSKKVDYIVHLGDVYYSGTPDNPTFLPGNEELDQFVRCWPRGRKPGSSYTLNSNHEMYSLGRGYFGNALADANFKHQNKTSYFLLQNAHWQIFGLDSAYASPDRATFMDGALDPAQIAFLKKARDPKRRSIVMTHHNPLSVYGKTTNRLWAQVEQGFSGRQPDYWYWGHIHNGIVYKCEGRSPVARNATRARCIGHSAIPFGFAWGLTKPETLRAAAPGALPTAFQPIDTVDYFAHEPVPRSPYIKNGYAVLRLSGAGISEEIYDEDGALTWRALG
jgi:hypothetical protein